MYSYKLIFPAVLVLLLAGIGLAATGKKAQPVKTEAPVVKQEKAPTSSQAPADPAQGDEINWQVISSGGTEAVSANYALKGTVGQTAVGYGSSVNFGLNHGFWQEFGCGIGIRGNVDGDADEQINVADLTYLVDYIFRGGPPPPCTEEGNVNGDPAEQINVADLTYLVDYLILGGPPPPPCP